MKTNTPEEEAHSNSEQTNDTNFQEGYAPIPSNNLDDNQTSESTPEQPIVEEKVPEKEVVFETVASTSTKDEDDDNSIIEESSYARLNQVVTSIRENAEVKEETKEEVPAQPEPISKEPISETPPIAPPLFKSVVGQTPPPLPSSVNPTVAPQPVAKETPLATQPTTTAEQPKKKPSGGNNTILYVLLGLLAIGLIAGAGVFILKQEPPIESYYEETVEVIEDDEIMALPEIVEVEVEDEEANPQVEIVEVAVAEPAQQTIVVAEVEKPKEVAKPKSDEAKPKATTEPKQPKKTEPIATTPPPVKEDVVYPLHTTIKYPTGNVYTGYINAAGKKDGQGTYSFASGDKYVGNWTNDQATGQGTYHSREGWKYVGSFVNLKFHGQGVWHFADGKTKKGVWENGVMKK